MPRCSLRCLGGNVCRRFASAAVSPFYSTTALHRSLIHFSSSTGGRGRDAVALAGAASGGCSGRDGRKAAKKKARRRGRACAAAPNAWPAWRAFATLPHCGYASPSAIFRRSSRRQARTGALRSVARAARIVFLHALLPCRAACLFCKRCGSRLLLYSSGNILLLAPCAMAPGYAAWHFGLDGTGCAAAWRMALFA